jgi:pSer/pThr/pTyr-binding forkhead associated (FHA) protein
MDDSPPPQTGPHPGAPADAPQPEGFVPLRLLLQPGGLCVELARPDMVIGRHSSADVRLCLPDVSRRHCRCVFADRRWKVLDQNSLNGTFVNGQRRPEAVLEHGDTVRIGSLTFVVDLSAARPTVLLPEREEEGARVGILRSIADVLPDGRERRKAS